MADLRLRRAEEDTDLFRYSGDWPREPPGSERGGCTWTGRGSELGGSAIVLGHQCPPDQLERIRDCPALHRLAALRKVKEQRLRFDTIVQSDMHLANRPAFQFRWACDTRNADADIAPQRLTDGAGHRYCRYGPAFAGAGIGGEAVSAGLLGRGEFALTNGAASQVTRSTIDPVESYQMRHGSGELGHLTRTPGETGGWNQP